MNNEENLQIRYLIVIASLLCALIIGYNAFYVPEITIPDVTVTTDNVSSEVNEEYIPKSVSSLNNKSNNAESNTKKQTEKININTATAEQLSDGINGIGTVMSQRIISYREDNGKFKSIDEIKNVSGIGDKTFEKIKDQITV
jgi:comEA protein